MLNKKHIHIHADKLAMLEFMLEKMPRMISRSKIMHYWKPRHTSEPGCVRGAGCNAHLQIHYLKIRLILNFDHGTFVT